MGTARVGINSARVVQAESLSPSLSVSVSPLFLRSVSLSPSLTVSVCPCLSTISIPLCPSVSFLSPSLIPTLRCLDFAHDPLIKDNIQRSLAEGIGHGVES